MSRTVTITIENGKATVETKGFKGKTCEDFTADLERAFGVRTDNKRTPEYDFKEVQQAGH